jgi:Aerotolerance regulator N-terminal/von Willebrand factor type A domain
MGFLTSWFVNPGYLALLPLVALPIIIHLLNRIRYKRVRWAAIEFLLMTERRAVRRAKLKQLILMALRTLLLAAALMALAQPRLRGDLAELLGGSSQVAILVDSSASMSVSNSLSGSAFDRAKQEARAGLATMPNAVRTSVASVSVRTDSPFGESVSNRKAVLEVLEAMTLTSGAADIPLAIRTAANVMAKGEPGGTLWLLSDLQAGNWRTNDTGAWDDVRAALSEAGNPRILITDMLSDVKAATRVNHAVSGVKLTPTVVVEGDSPNLTVTVAFHGRKSEKLVNVALFLDDKQVGSRAIKGGTESDSAIFKLPELTTGDHAGYVELARDEMPGDNRHYFIIRTSATIPVLLVDGAKSGIPFRGASDFLSAAMQPEMSGMGARSSLKPTVIADSKLATEPLSPYAAIFLSGVRRLDDKVAKRVEKYVRNGGLLVIFPGNKTDRTAWNKLDFLGVQFAGIMQAEEDEPFRIDWASPIDPLTSGSFNDSVREVTINSMFELRSLNREGILATAADGKPFIVRNQVGKGKVLAFAVSAMPDFSNLPMTWLFLHLAHQPVKLHKIEAAEPLARPAYSELRLAIHGPGASIIQPDGEIIAISPLADQPNEALFVDTTLAGIYHLEQTGPKGEMQSRFAGAINVPVGESNLDRVTPEKITQLLDGSTVSFKGTSENGQSLSGSEAPQSSASSFPLVFLALLCLLGEVILGWTLSRPAKTQPLEESAALAPNGKSV